MSSDSSTGSRGGRVPKRQRAAAAAPAGRAPLDGIKVFVPVRALPQGRLVHAAWQRSVPGLGGAVTEDAGAADITHVVVPAAPGGGAAWDALPPALRPGAAPPGLRHVTAAWLADSIKRQDLQPADAYDPAAAAAPVQRPRPAASAAAGEAAAVPSDDKDLISLPARQAWLGPLWRPECAAMSMTELALQGDYDRERCERIGNERLVQALVELQKFEKALSGDTLTNPITAKQTTNHRSLNYAQAGASVRTCAYRLAPPVEKGQLPWVAASIATEVTDILKTGTCAKLELFRADEPVRDSKGVLRRDSAGAATRRRFCKLLNVGPKMAQRWWDLGLRTFEDVEAAVAGRGIVEGKKPLTLSPVQRFGLQHRADLMEGPTAGDLREMRQAVEAALAAASGVHQGWALEMVGGSRRQQRPGSTADDSQPHHDADFMASHPTYQWDEGLIERLRDELLRRGKLLPANSGAFLSTQKERTADLTAKVLQELTGEEEQRPNLQSDRHDHIFGVYRTTAGKLRRIDIILVTPDSLPYGLIGWIGSTMYNRYLRRHMGRIGMHMNSHGLWRVVRAENGQPRLAKIPEDAPPLNRRGAEWWPPGWGPDAAAAGDGAAPKNGAAAPGSAAAAVAAAPGDGVAARAATAQAGGQAAAAAGRRRVVCSQRDVFELLGLPWREPYQRDIP